MKRRVSILGTVLAVAFLDAMAAGDPSGYPQSLAQVYGAYQRILTLKDACATAIPKQAAQLEKAFGGWKGRNENVIVEINDHVTAMIKAQSKDAKDFPRNLAKYEGERLQEREDGKRAFLALPRAEVELHCRDLPKTLGTKETDLEIAYADELNSIRSRR